MNFFSSAVLGLLVLFVTTASLAKPELIESHEIFRNVTAHKYRLDNGLTVVLVENPRAPATDIYHWVKAGSLHERPGITGIAHLFEHMMFRPLKDGEPSFSEKMQRLAAQVNASTRFESTVYNTTVPTQHLKEALKHESDRFKHLRVSDALLDVEREAVRSEYSSKFDVNPIVDLWFNIYQEAFPKHPYGWMIVGFREDLNKIKAQDANQFFKQYYTPNNTGLFIAGNFKAKDVLPWVQSHYSDWAPGAEAKMPKEFSANTSFVRETGNLVSATPVALIGHRTPSFSKDNFLVMGIANHILYSTSMSLANQRLIFKKPMASDVSPFNFSYDNGMMKAIVTPLPGQKLEPIIEGINSLPADFDKLSDEEYEAYLNEYRTALLEQLQRNSNLASYLSMSWGKWNSLSFLPDLVQKELTIPREEVSKFIRRHLTKNNTVVVETKKGSN